MTTSDLTRRLSIVAVSPVGEAGGAEVLLVDILGGLAAEGVEVTLAALGEGPLGDLAASRSLDIISGPGVSFHRPSSVLRAGCLLRRIVLARNPDIVHASHPKGQLIARIACFGIRTVHTTQLYEPPSRSVFDRATKLFGGVRFAINEQTAAAVSTGKPAVKSVVIRPGCDTARLVARAAAGDGRAAWSSCGLDPGDGAKIIMVGRLQRFKGPFDFLLAAERVLKRAPATRLLILGPDSPQEPGLRAELEATIAGRHLGHAVGLPGRLSAEDLAATVAGSTLLVHPAAYEPFGLVLVEALALGTPVIAYDSPGPRLILSHGGGQIVSKGSTTALTEAIENALAQPDLRRRWAREGPAAARHFELSNTVGSYLNAFLAAADPAGRCPGVSRSAPGSRPDGGEDGRTASR